MAHDVNQREKDVAAQVRSALVERISVERYDLWMPSESKWNWNAGQLSIVFPSEFKCQIAKKMLSGEIAKAVESVTGDCAQEIAFTFAPKLLHGVIGVDEGERGEIRESIQPTETRRGAGESRESGERRAISGDASKAAPKHDVSDGNENHGAVPSNANNENEHEHDNGHKSVATLFDQEAADKSQPNNIHQSPWIEPDAATAHEVTATAQKFENHNAQATVPENTNSDNPEHETTDLAKVNSGSMPPPATSQRGPRIVRLNTTRGQAADSAEAEISTKRPLDQHSRSDRSNNGASNSPTQPRQPIRLWEHFVHGTSNQLAGTTANLVVAEPGRLTPVLVHGPSGSGKSFLMAAVAQRLRSEKRLRRVVHMTAEQFTNDFTEGLRGGGLPMFRRKYRDVDALIIEDVQFFIGKKSTLVELRHTIDNLLRLNKQVLITADRPLNDLQQLGDELLGRLRGGLSSPMFPLDEAIRKRLLTQYLLAAGVDVDEETIEQLSTRISGDGRVVSGIAKRLMAARAMTSERLTWDQCWGAVCDLVQATQPVVRLGDIERVVCSTFGLEPNSLQSASKTRHVSQPRMLAMFLARKYTPAAYKEIGHYFGNRRHSTVISAEKTVENWLATNENINASRGLTVKDVLRQVESQLQVG